MSGVKLSAQFNGSSHKRYDTTLQYQVSMYKYHYTALRNTKLNQNQQTSLKYTIFYVYQSNEHKMCKREKLQLGSNLIHKNETTQEDPVDLYLEFLMITGIISPLGSIFLW